MLRIFPKEQIWDEAPLTRFVNDIRSIDPEATGTPLQNYEAANQIRDSYLHSAILACAMVLFVLFIDLLRVGPLLISLISPLAVVGVAMHSPAAMQNLGTQGLAVLYIVLAFIVAAIFDPLNIGKALLAMLPPLGGGLMTFGILALLKTNLNPANMIVLPLLLGIGVDSGVYVVHDYRMQAPGTYQISSSIINAITLTSTTTMVGFGLSFASRAAFASAAAASRSVRAEPLRSRMSGFSDGSAVAREPLP
jgi:predicted RND superfamily exporter protein